MQFRKGNFCPFWNDTGVFPYNYVAYIYDFAKAYLRFYILFDDHIDQLPWNCNHFNNFFTLRPFC